MSLRERFLGKDNKEEEKPRAQILPLENPAPAKPEPLPEIIDDNGEEAPNNPVYGSDRTRRQKNMLSFHCADDSREHIPYNQIIRVRESAGKIITIYTHTCIIHLEGEKMRPISERIKHGSLSYVRESSRVNPVKAEDGAAVYSIRFDDAF